MKTGKRILSFMLATMLVAFCFTGCSSKNTEKYSDTVLIIGYTESVAPFLEVDDNGKATGFYADLFKAIFDDVKGDLKSYVFEKVEEGYALEEDGGFTDSKGKVYSAGLLMGAVSKNNGTFNKDYSFTEPVITDRIIAVTSKGSSVEGFDDFKGKRAVVVSDVAKTAFDKNSAISGACKSVKTVEGIDDALSMLDNGKADVVVTDEFSFMPSDKAESYTRLEGELDVIEYVIACAKYSGWKNSINEAIRELQSPDYGNGDGFTKPIVEKYFGYNASSFEYKTEGDK